MQRVVALKVLATELLKTELIEDAILAEEEAGRPPREQAFGLKAGEQPLLHQGASQGARAGVRHLAQHGRELFIAHQPALAEVSEEGWPIDAAGWDGHCHPAPFWGRR